MLSPYPESTRFTSSPINTYPSSSSLLKDHFPRVVFPEPPFKVPY